MDYRVSTRDRQSLALVSRLAEEDESILEERTRLIDGLMVERLFRLSAGTRYLPYLMIAALFATYGDSIGYGAMIGLVALYSAGTLWLDRQRSLYAQDDGHLQRPEYWGRRFALGSVATGLTWGLIGWFGFDPADYTRQAIFGVAFSGIVVSSVVTRGPYLPAFYAFLLPLAVPVFLRAMLDGNNDTRVMAGFGMLLALTSALWARQSNARERMAAGLRLRNAELVAEIDTARAAATAAQSAAEEALQDRAAGFNGAEKLAGIGSWRWQVDEDHWGWSDNMFRLLGLSPSATPVALGTLLERVHPEDRAAIQAMLSTARKRGGSGAARFRCGDETAGYKCFRLLAEARRDKGGHIEMLTGALIQEN